METKLGKNEILKLSNEESNRLTKEYLQIALIRLMSKKKFETITITELVKEAGVSRTAFYRNYSEKEDIILEICDNIINGISNSISSDKYKDNPYYFLYDLFTFIKNNSKMFNILLQAKLFNPSIVPLNHVMNVILKPNSVKEHYKILAIDSGLYTIIQSWFENGMKEDINFMANLCYDIFNKIYN